MSSCACDDQTVCYLGPTNTQCNEKLSKFQQIVSFFLRTDKGLNSNPVSNLMKNLEHIFVLTVIFLNHNDKKSQQSLFFLDNKEVHVGLV